MSLVDLSQESIYGKGTAFAGDDFIPNRNTEFWFTPLGYGNKNPFRKIITLTSPANKSDRIIEIVSNNDFIIYRGDVLLFEPRSVYTVISATTHVSGITEVPVYPIDKDLLLGSYSISYGMTPILSAREGQSFEADGSSASAFNKSQGVWTSNAIVNKGGTLILSGSYYRKDIGASSLFREGTEKRNSIYIEVRYSPFLDFVDPDGGVYIGGEGPGAISCLGALEVADLNSRKGREGLVKFELRLKLDGSPERYQVLSGIYEIDYCAQDALGQGFYDIIFNPEPIEDECGYCPQDSTGFYDFT